MQSDPQYVAETDNKEEDEELYSQIFVQLEHVWTGISQQFLEIGLSGEEYAERKKIFRTETIQFLQNRLQETKQEKHRMKKQCLLLQRNIFKILRVFSKKGYNAVSKPISATDIIMAEPDHKSLQQASSNETTEEQDTQVEIEISDSTYTEINQILTNDSEFNDIMRNIPDKVSSSVLLEKVVPPFSNTHSLFLNILKQLSKEYFSRLMRFLKSVLLLREASEELEYYKQIDKPISLPESEMYNNDGKMNHLLISPSSGPTNSDVIFAQMLPSIEQCRVCISELDKVDSNDIEMVYKVVNNLLNGDNFNNLSNQYLGKIHYQIEMIETQREKNFGMIIDLSSNIIQLWKELYNFSYEAHSNNDRFDSKIVKASEGEVSSLGLMKSSICYLEVTYNELLAKKETRLNSMREKIKQCYTIFDRLKADSAETDQFAQRYELGEAADDISEKKLIGLNNELEALKEKKKLYIKDIIKYLMIDINKLQERMFMDAVTDLNEEIEEKDDDKILVILENKMEDLKALFENHEMMFDKIEQFYQLMEDKRQLDEASKNPSRLLARNSGAILLKEEKLRKLIKKRFPRLCEDLQEQLTKFNEQTNSCFTMNSNFYQLLDSVNFEAEKNKSKAASPSKKQAFSERLSPIKSSNFSKSVQTKSKNVSPAKSSDTRFSPVRVARARSPAKIVSSLSPERARATRKPVSFQQKEKSSRDKRLANNHLLKSGILRNIPHLPKPTEIQKSGRSSSSSTRSGESSTYSSLVSNNGNIEKDISLGNLNLMPIENADAESTPRGATSKGFLADIGTENNPIVAKRKLISVSPLGRKIISDDTNNNQKNIVSIVKNTPRLSPLKRFSPIRSSKSKLPVDFLSTRSLVPAKRSFGDNVPDLQNFKYKRPSERNDPAESENNKENLIETHLSKVIDSKVIDDSINDDSMYNSWRLKRLESIRKTASLSKEENNLET